jgi:ammonium transporter, Amt family
MFKNFCYCKNFKEERVMTNIINSGDTAFVLLCAGLVMLMTPGLALFYGGMVRKKNVLSVIMQCFTILGLISLQWVLFGYSLAFSPGNSFIGSLHWLGLNGVGLEPYADYSATIPHQAFMIFQAMFAIITPALILGAFVERIKFSAFLIFSLLWSFLVYDPVCHWVWGVGGFIRNMGALDFAGGTVVHINAGISALVMALLLGKRDNFDFSSKPIPPHNLTMTALGTALLWFGWFGFNAGSALSANGLAVNAFVVTNTCAAAAGLSWALIEWLINEKPTLLGTASGAVAGLVAITPASGFVGVLPAIIIGILVSLVCFFMVSVIKPKLGYDDSLDAFGIHGIGGLLGAIMTGVFASKVINPSGANGLIFGNPELVLIQIKACLITIAYSAIVTFILYKVIDAVIGMRISKKEENMGLDLSSHHESAYTVLE